MNSDPFNSPDATYFEGIPTFFRSRLGGVEDLEAGDLAVVGAPYDSTNHLGRPGARFGPRAVREASCYFSSYYNALPNREFVDIDAGTKQRIPDPLPIFDLGDVSGYTTDLDATTASIATAVGSVVERRALPIVIGGDHYVAYPSWKGAAEAAAAQSGKPDFKVGYVQVDSHFDLVDEFPHAGRMGHGTFARRIAEHPNASIEHMAWLGLNGTLVSAELYDFIREHNSTLVTTDELQASDWEDRVRSTLRKLGECDGVYVSLDIDVVDGAQAPGTTSVVFGGIDAPRFVRLVELMGEIPNLIGIDLCEVAPNLDPSGRTARLAALALVTFVGGRLFETEDLARE